MRIHALQLSLYPLFLSLFVSSCLFAVCLSVFLSSLSLSLCLFVLLFICLLLILAVSLSLFSFLSICFPIRIPRPLLFGCLPLYAHLSLCLLVCLCCTNLCFCHSLSGVSLACLSGSSDVFASVPCRLCVCLSPSLSLSLSISRSPHACVFVSVLLSRLRDVVLPASVSGLFLSPRICLLLFSVFYFSRCIDVYKCLLLYVSLSLCVSLCLFFSLSCSETCIIHVSM